MIIIHSFFKRLNLTFRTFYDSVPNLLIVMVFESRFSIDLCDLLESASLGEACGEFREPG